MKRFFFWLVVVGVVAGVGAAGYSRLFATKHGATNGRYRTGVVQRGDVVHVVHSTGTVQPVRSVQVGSFVSGPVTTVHVDFNDRVTKGQLMAEVDPRIYEANLKHEEATLVHSKADLARVKALLHQAVRMEKRALLLKPENAIAQTDVEQYEADRESLEAQVDLANAAIQESEANLANAQINLGFTKIESPVDGIVIDRKVDPGQTVAAAFQTPVMFVIAPDLDKLVYVWASVDEADIGYIRDAQSRDEPATFTVDAYSNDTFHGKIKQVRLNPTTVQNVVTYTVIVEASNSELKLLPGMTATLIFQIEKHVQVLKVPNAALRFRPGPSEVREQDQSILEGDADDKPSGPDAKSEGSDAVVGEGASLSGSQARKIVWIDDGERLSAVEVITGLSDKKYTEIVSGDLSEGQELVVGSKTAAAK